MKILNMLFEEDIEMKDAIEDIAENDDSEDIIIGAIEDRFSKEGEIHLFTNNEEVPNDDGLTDEEELAANVAILNMDPNEDLSDEEPDDDIDAILADDEEDFSENL